LCALRHGSEEGLGVGDVAAEALTCAPRVESSSTTARASALLSPDREMKAMLLAPHSTNSRARLRPRPPRPPTKRYVTEGSSLRESLALRGGDIWESA
jgi:hypothetical protein